MRTVADSIADCRKEVDEMIQSAVTCSDCWVTPRATGKWSPWQVVEHIALSLEASALDVKGERSKFPNLPPFIRPLARSFLFRRVLRTGVFQKARTNKAMDPAKGPDSPAAAKARLESAWSQFSVACAEVSARGDVMTSRIFGTVTLSDYVRFQGLHTRHHRGQMKAPNATN